MFEFIGSLIKYSLLVLTVLVLSHIIQIQGVTISQHVLNGMHWVSGYSPKADANRITTDFSRTMQTRMDSLNKVDNDVGSADQQALNKVIEHSSNKKK